MGRGMQVKQIHLAALSATALALMTSPVSASHHSGSGGDSSSGNHGVPAILSDPATITAHPMPDFSYAGYEFGNAALPVVTKVIDVADYGAIADDDRDDSVALRAAVAAAGEHEGLVRVQLGKGRYQLTEILWIEHSNVVLAGMGMGEGGTQIYMPRPLNQVDDGGALDELREYLSSENKYARSEPLNLDVLFSEYSWTAGFIWTQVPNGRPVAYLEEKDRPIEKVADIASGEQFERTLTVPNASALKVGDVLKIFWHNRAGPEGPLVKSLYGDTEEAIGSRHWEYPDRPLVQQATRIEAISGNMVTIADPLLHSISDELPAYFAQWEHLTNVGIEDLALVFPENPYFGHHNESGFNGIYMTGVHNGWIDNVRVTNGDTGILTDDAANLTIRNIITDGEHKAHYSVHIGSVHNVLVEGLTVFNPTVHTFSINTRSTKSVYTNSVAWNAPTLDQHAGSNHQNLYDNLTVHITPDRMTDDGKHLYDLYRAGGAPYWLPGHGKYNTTWNLNVVVDSGVAPEDPVVIYAGSEGPDARIVGMHGNRPLELFHKPTPYTEMMGEPVRAVPSLYYWQLLQRQGKE